MRRPNSGEAREVRRGNAGFLGWISIALVLVAIGAGFALRLSPCLRQPGFDFVIDAAAHARLTADVVATGRVPAVDSLSEAPLGRRVARQLPLGLYAIGSLFHRLLSLFGARDLRWNLAILTALAGALSAIPAALGALAVFGDPLAAAVAALVIAFLPAHLARTDGLSYRYDAPGTLLVTLEIALALATLAETRTRRRLVLAGLAALALVAAMSVWRVSLLALELELVFAAGAFLVLGGVRALRDRWIALAIVGTLGLLPIPYLAVHGFLRSTPWLAGVGLALLIALPPLAPRSRWPARAVALLVILGIAFAIGRSASSTDYAALTGAIARRLGLAHGADPGAALMRTVVELQGMSPLRLLAGREAFAWLGGLVLVSPLLFSWLRAARSPRSRSDAAKGVASLPSSLAPALLVTLTAGLAAATLVFQRSAVLLAPLVTIVTGGLVARALDALRDPRRRARAAAVLALAAVAATSAIVAGVRAATTETTRLAPNLRSAIAYLRDHSAPNAIVLSDWDAGYDIQSLAGRRTAVDGLLESPENRRRILAFYGALLDTSAAPLDSLCRRVGARWLLLPPASAIYAIALVDGDPLAAAIASGRPIPRGPLTDRLIVHLIEGDREYPNLKRVLESGGYTVFEVTSVSAPTAAATRTTPVR